MLLSWSVPGIRANKLFTLLHCNPSFPFLSDFYSVFLPSDGAVPHCPALPWTERLQPCSSPAVQLSQGRSPAVPPAAVLQSVLHAQRCTGEYFPLNMQKNISRVLKS